MMRICTLLVVTASSAALAQSPAVLTVDKIMADPKWMGVSPANIQWGDNSKTVYFNWNPENRDTDELYQLATDANAPVKAAADMKKKLSRNALVFSKSRQKAIFERDGDISIVEIRTGTERQLTNTVEREVGPIFNKTEDRVIFQRGDNFFSLSLQSAELKQLTNFTRNRSRATPATSKQDEWLKKDQLKEFDIIRKKDQVQKDEEVERKSNQPKRAKEFYIDDKSSLSSLRVSPDERFVVFRITRNPEGNRNIIVPNYVTASGYTEDINGRTKVGNLLPVFESYVHDLQRDTIYPLAVKDIPGIKDLPNYLKDYPEQLAERTKKNEDRKVTINGPFWNEEGSLAVVVASSADNKDRWIMSLDQPSGKLKLIDRQRDEAWIGGPGIGGAFGGGLIGWLDSDHIYYQSESTGYSHLYTANVVSGEKKQLTSGQFEVQSLRLSNDKKHFYFTANIDHPGITHFYRMPVSGGKPIQLTGMKGGNEVTLSPDEKWLAIRYSYSNKPWELYLQENRPGAKARQITDSRSTEFKAYPWREPEVVKFTNQHNADVYARVYRPANPDPAKPAVLFVHGAGYLQNVHFWWSQYFREYMFNNLLTDKGYTVIDVDYTGSSGYGRNHRTGIYRHMGGKDLSDHVDAVKLLVEKYDVNPKNIGMYGGSYGGFMTLMALFNEPATFKSGAALRSVTDWAHYNHGYTSNILNEPANDDKAYRRSSPLYFAEGLRGNLLMAHGMVDVNVNFQDIVRLSQRLIELKKENWELAVYPVEDHGFTEPSSWTDEYKRILKLFETTLKTK